jgi:hypothetical protein
VASATALEARRDAERYVVQDLGAHVLPGCARTMAVYAVTCDGAP